MDLKDLKKQRILEEFGIRSDFGRILAFVDFANVNYWYENDRQTHDRIGLQENEKLTVDLEKLKELLGIISQDARFYYGHDPRRLQFIQKAQNIFGKNRVFTKSIRWVRHHLEDREFNTNTRRLFTDNDGKYVLLPKWNFDVEMSVDAIKTSAYYDTFCLLSSDADFLYLVKYLKQKKGKKVIIIKGGHVIHQLKQVSDLVINAQDIKKYITRIKQKPGD